MATEILEVLAFVGRALIAWRFWLVFGLSLVVAVLVALFAPPAVMRLELHIPIPIVGMVGGLAWDVIADWPRRPRRATTTRHVSWWRRGR